MRTVPLSRNCLTHLIKALDGVSGGPFLLLALNWRMNLWRVSRSDLVDKYASTQNAFRSFVYMIKNEIKISTKLATNPVTVVTSPDVLSSVEKTELKNI